MPTKISTHTPSPVISQDMSYSFNVDLRRLLGSILVLKIESLASSKSLMNRPLFDALSKSDSTFRSHLVAESSSSVGNWDPGRSR